MPRRASSTCCPSTDASLAAIAAELKAERAASRGKLLRQHFDGDWQGDPSSDVFGDEASGS